MQKIISFLMALIMSIFSFVPGMQPADAYTQAEWYAKVVDEFNLTYDLQDGSNYGKLDADDANFEVVEACYDWGVLVGEFDADAAVTDVLVGTSLAAAARLDNEEGKTGIEVAIDAKIVTVKVSVFGKLKEAVISKADADAALKAAKEAYLANLNDVDNGGVIATNEGDTIAMNELNAEDIDEADIDYISYAGIVKPFATNAAGEFEDQSLLDKLNISFNAGPFKVKAKAQDSGFDVSVSGSIKGVGISKKYEVRNFDIATKFDGSLVDKQINEAYLIMNYDLNDITTVDASYAAYLAEKEAPEGANEMDFFTKISEGMYEFTTDSTQTIPIFTYDVPIPNCPAITVGITAQLKISVDGYIQLVISSSEMRGIEIVNNKVRAISESEAGQSTLTAQARLEATLTIFADVKCVSICLIDVSVTVGLGVVVTVKIVSDTGMQTLNIPCDFLFDVNVKYPNMQNVSITGNVKIYGIVKLAIGENSILSKVGLKKSWTLVDQGNGTFVDKDFDIVKAA